MRQDGLGDVAGRHRSGRRTQSSDRRYQLQRTASAWWESRHADVPHLVEVTGDQIAPAVETARDKAFDFVFIDTPARAEPVNAAAAQAAHFSHSAVPPEHG